MSDGVLMRRLNLSAGAPGVEGMVPRHLLREAVFTRLLAKILRGDYRRGQRLRLDELAGDMGVSRTPVREALVPLETLRFVTVQRYVGVIIASWSVENMVERLRIVQHMLDAAVPPGPALVLTADPPGGSLIRDGMSEVGAFAAMAEWVLDAAGRPVSADWLRSQRPALDMFYAPEIARVHGIDMSRGGSERSGLLAQAQGALLGGDLRAACRALDAFAECVATIDQATRPMASAMRRP